MTRRRASRPRSNACPVGEVVQLSAGTFTVNNHILINKGITLRGAGLRITTLQKTNRGDEQEQILIVGPSRWPHIDDTHGRESHR